ncbi:Piwi-domain-containing protein, partial [Exidia glandulosa HHB12029]
MMTRDRATFPSRGGFDGNKMLYLSSRSDYVVGKGEQVINFVDVPAGDEGGNSITTNLFTVQLRLVSQIAIGELNNGLTSLLRGVAALNNLPSVGLKKLIIQQSYPAIMAMNAVVQAVGRLASVVHATRSVVYTQASEARGNAFRCKWLELYRGYFQSVRPSIGRLLVNVDITYALMYKSGPLHEVVAAFLGETDIRRIQRGHRHRIETFLRRVLIRAVHDLRNKARAIIRVTADGADSYTFTHADGSEETVAAFFLREHPPALNFPQLPCVVVHGKVNGQQTEIVYPMERCVVLPGQVYRRTVPPDVVSDVVQHAARGGPRARLQAIRSAYNTLGHNASDFVRAAGITVETEPLNLVGRTLTAPQLLLRSRGNDSLVSVTVDDRSRFDLRNKRFHEPASTFKWAVLYFYGRRGDRVRERQAVDEFARQLALQLRALGIRIDVPSRGPPPPGRESNFQGIEEIFAEGNIQEALRSITRRLPNFGPKLVIAVMAENSDGARNAIKRIGDIDLNAHRPNEQPRQLCGFVTQGVVLGQLVDKYNKGYKPTDDPYLNNLALKINMKLGGVNWRLPVERFPWYHPMHRNLTRTMIVGADVSHPGAGNTTSPSICGVVASMDSESLRYAARISVQLGGRRTEIIVGLKDLMKPLFVQYYHRNGGLPVQLLYYRDGVGESQLADVTDLETQAIREAYEDAKVECDQRNAPALLITFVVVTKRHHQRFFPAEARDGDRNGNCQPGSVFDKDIGHPIFFDFYLQSQYAIIGTARPAHYIVTVNDMGFDCNTLQQFTYDMCFIYTRATLSVSIPAPVYYADLVCRREKFMFPEGYLDSEAGSVVSGHQNAEDEQELMKKYQENFGPIHRMHEGRMFFI